MRRNLAAEPQDTVISSKRVRTELVEKGESLQENLDQQICSTTIPESIISNDASIETIQDEKAIEEAINPQDSVKPPIKFSRKTVAIFLCYNGFGFFGMQFNAGFKTIEGELLTALSKVGAIGEENKFQLAKLYFQRTSKTDKGVSAVRQIVSLKMDVARDYLEPLNSTLPPQIRVLRILRTTQSFNCKYYCSSRFYQYLCPTFAFSPTYEQTYEGYRIDKNTVTELGEILSIFKGTHNFHNYTSSVKANDPSCKRYIMDISPEETFTDDKTKLEFISINIHGQSFMLHQIRKMIGITIAVMKKYAEKEIIKRSFSLNTIETPKAPSLGLMLARQEFKGYDRKFGDDGIHQPITWESVEKEVTEFRDMSIYPHIIQQESEEKTMFHWLGHLKKHNFTSESTEAAGKEVKSPTVGEIVGDTKEEIISKSSPENPNLKDLTESEAKNTTTTSQEVSKDEHNTVEKSQEQQ